jgi:hypothetical protein
MKDDRVKTPRTLLIADHLWEAFSTMAEEMGSDRDALLNQALYTFARLNGFLVPADLTKLGMVPRAALTDSGRLRIAPEPTTQEESEPPTARVQDASGRVAQLASGIARRSAPADDSNATTMDLDGVAGFRPPVSIAQQAAAGAGPSLVLLADDGSELERVRKDRFVIGRGKHCDLVINSGKVSREHAAIVREGSAWFIEDLGSSNGTWFDARRITRRQIQDGDEYFVCAEKLRCALTPPGAELAAEDVDSRR